MEETTIIMALSPEDQFKLVFMNPTERYKLEFLSLMKAIDSYYPRTGKITNKKSFMLAWMMDDHDDAPRLRRHIQVGLMDMRCNPKGHADFAVVLKHLTKEIVIALDLHKRCDMDFIGTVHELKFVEKCLTSLVLHAPAGLFGFWDFSVRHIARELDFVDVFTIID